MAIWEDRAKQWLSYVGLSTGRANVVSLGAQMFNIYADGRRQGRLEVLAFLREEGYDTIADAIRGRLICVESAPKADGR